MLRKVPQVWSDGSGTDGMTGVGAGGGLCWGGEGVEGIASTLDCCSEEAGGGRGGRWGLGLGLGGLEWGSEE